MKKKLPILVVFVIFTQLAFCQNNWQDSIPIFFNEIKSATSLHKDVWNRDLYGPIILIDGTTKMMYANMPDSLGALKPQGSIYVGKMPAGANPANTAIDWNGRRWALLCMPLPKDKYDRVQLFAHELFHKDQPALGFKTQDPQNKHLDEKNGRIYLRLELQALKMALLSDNDKEIKKHLTNAIIFRKYRTSLYPNSSELENLVELNEGIAEYTGLVMSGRTKKQSIDYLSQTLDEFSSNPSFVRSFAYRTTPVYGYLLQSRDKRWNLQITNETDLTGLFINAFALQIPSDVENAALANADLYNYKTILAEEIKRDELKTERINNYKKMLLDQPHFEIFCTQKMHISFDPRTLIPIEDKGTVYPTLRVTDDWGILQSEDAALLNSNWDKVNVTVPTKIEEKLISGKGWKLELTEGYQVVLDEASKNYQLVKKK